MTQEELKNTLREKIDYIVSQCNRLNESFDLEPCRNFKYEVKSIRLFMEMVRLNDGESADLKLSMACKKLYYITSLFMDANREQQRLIRDNKLTSLKEAEMAHYMSKAAGEWKKSYSKMIITKLDKQVMEHDYSKIPNAVLKNFFSRHITGQYVTRRSKTELAAK